jgi:hypothetical protein
LQKFKSLPVEEAYIVLQLWKEWKDVTWLLAVICNCSRDSQESLQSHWFPIIRRWMLEPMALSWFFRIFTKATNYAHELCRIPFTVLWGTYKITSWLHMCWKIKELIVNTWTHTCE